MSKTRYLKIQTENNWEYFTSQSGGNNRCWAKRYSDMMKRYEFLKTAPVSEEYKSGFKACLDIFHERDSILLKEKEKK